jgi:hypothetical protein
MSLVKARKEFYIQEKKRREEGKVNGINIALELE